MGLKANEATEDWSQESGTQARFRASSAAIPRLVSRAGWVTLSHSSTVRIKEKSQ
jgi:hypothetical protein